ncbi:MAG: carboxypeptidase-like regulatory domain-containing protein [Myxococcaceae bacterium]|nr:carboxypeptidase-like regulatory domain-containing protein [Myxococcaceae bacterium]
MSLSLRLTLFAGLAAGCTGGPSDPPPCLTDNDCQAGLVCFVDGCGDPTRDLAVEVTGGSTTGLFAQDFEVKELGTSQDFFLPGPITIGGSFQRERTAGVDPTQRSIYTEEVLVRATGESVLLPGVTRTSQARFSQTDRGTFSMGVGQGRYTVTAFPTSREVPPVTFTNVVASLDAGVALNFAFPSVEGAITLSGRLLRRRLPGSPPTELYITQAEMDLQAFNPVTGEPLSQRIETSTGRPGSRGDFILIMSPLARSLASVELVASPRELGALVPTQRFTVSPPFPSTLTLELGDFGEPIPSVRGVVLGLDGEPLSGATVLFEGRTTGGGQFRSRPVQTGADGAYSVDLLPSDGSYTVTAVPPPGARSAVTQAQVRVMNMPGVAPSLSPSSIRCIERIAVRGTVMLPDQTPAAMMRVRAVETARAATRPTPLEDVEVLTDENGTYDLRLDPGAWRLEFLPAVDLPQTSRLITVSATAAADGGAFERQQLAPITLPRGRRITGTVASNIANRGPTPLSNAEVRFFRVTRIENKPTAVLLGTGVTNGLGTYVVILPTREQPRAAQ